MEDETSRTRRWMPLARALGGDLWDWLRRRPPAVGDGQQALPHSADLRMIVLALAAAEIITEAIIDAIIPAPYRYLHIVWLAAIFAGSLAFAASTARRPHLLGPDALVLRVAPAGEVVVPLDAIAAVRQGMHSAKGVGPRPFPDDPGAVAYSITGTTHVVLDLARPVATRLRKGGVVQASRIYFATDLPSQAVRALRGAGTGQPSAVADGGRTATGLSGREL